MNDYEMKISHSGQSKPRGRTCVNRVTPKGGALEGALALAATIAANGPLALAATKAVLLGSADWTTAEGWRRQDELVAPVFTSEDAREGAAAFAEKRRPVWRGR